jgi:hypothetical protein
MLIRSLSKQQYVILIDEKIGVSMDIKDISLVVRLCECCNLDADEFSALKFKVLT